MAHWLIFDILIIAMKELRNFFFFFPLFFIFFHSFFLFKTVRWQIKLFIWNKAMDALKNKRFEFVKNSIVKQFWVNDHSFIHFCFFWIYFSFFLSQKHSSFFICRSWIRISTFHIPINEIRCFILNSVHLHWNKRCQNTFKFNCSKPTASNHFGKWWSERMGRISIFSFVFDFLGYFIANHFFWYLTFRNC